MSVNVGSIEAVMSLRDEMSSRLDAIASKLGDFGSKATSVGGIVTLAMTAATAAITATAAAIVELGDRGSRVDDVTNAFDRMTKGAGVDATAALAQLRQGVAGTVSDFDLMAASNKLMGAGMTLTADQFGIVANAARDLAKNTGKDIPETFDLITGALTTGRAKTLQAAGAFIELKGASAELTTQLKSEGEGMTTSADIATKRGAVMEELQQIVARNGIAEADFKEKLEAGRTAIINWADKLATAVSNSDALKAGLDAVQKAVGDAFGPKQEDAIKAIVHYLDEAAISVVGFGAATVPIVATVGEWWNKLVITLGETANLLDFLAVGFLYVAKAVAEVVNVATFGNFKTSVDNIGKSVTDLMDRIHTRQATLQENAVAIGDWNKAGDKMQAVLDGIKAKMEAAATAANTHKAAANGLAGAFGGSSGGGLSEAALATAEAIDKLRKANDVLSDVIDQARAHQVPLNTVIEDYGKKAYDAVGAATAYGQAISASIAQVAKAYELAQSKQFDMGAGLEHDETGHVSSATDVKAFGPTQSEYDAYWTALYKSRDQLETDSIARSGALQVQAAEYAMALDQRRVASARQLAADMDQVEALKTSAAIAGENQRYQLSLADVTKGSDLYVTLTANHEAAVAQMTSDWQAGVNKRQAESKSFVTDFGKTMDAIPDIFVKAFEGGGGIEGALKALGASLAKDIATPIEERLKEALTNVATSAHAAQASVTTSTGAVDAAVSTVGSTASSAAEKVAGIGPAAKDAGMMTSLATGAMTAGIGLAISGVASLISHWFDAGAAMRKANADATTSIQSEEAELIKQYGSLDNIRGMAGNVGAALAAGWGSQSLQGLKAFNAQLDLFNAAMANTFTGNAAFAAANTIVEQVQAAGGASVLTASEMANVNSQLKDALDKYAALGQDAPQAMVDLELATRKAADTTVVVTAAVTAAGVAWLRSGSAATVTLDDTKVAARNAADAAETALKQLVASGTASVDALAQASQAASAAEITAADAAYNAWAKSYAYINGSGGGDPTHGALDPGRYQNYDDWLTAFLHFNPGDEGRAKSAWDQSGGDSGNPSYAVGTAGAFVDFGAGTDVTLHGREKVVTEGGASADDKHLAVLTGLRSDFRRLPQTLGLALRDALNGKV